MWRIPFAHHPPYSAGPQHHNTKEMAQLMPLFERAGVARDVQRPRAQLPALAGGRDRLLRHRRRGKFRGGTPDGFDAAHTRSWSNLCHFLLARIEGDRMTVRAIGGRDDAAASLVDIQRWTPDGTPLMAPITVRRTR